MVQSYTEERIISIITKHDGIDCVSLYLSSKHKMEPYMEMLQSLEDFVLNLESELIVTCRALRPKLLNGCMTEDMALRTRLIILNACCLSAYYPFYTPTPTHRMQHLECRPRKAIPCARELIVSQKVRLRRSEVSDYVNTEQYTSGGAG